MLFNTLAKCLQRDDTYPEPRIHDKIQPHGEDLPRFPKIGSVCMVQQAMGEDDGPDERQLVVRIELDDFIPFVGSTPSGFYVTLEKTEDDWLAMIVPWKEACDEQIKVLKEKLETQRKQESRAQSQIGKVMKRPKTICLL